MFLKALRGIGTGSDILRYSPALTMTILYRQTKCVGVRTEHGHLQCQIINVAHLEKFHSQD